MGLSNRSPILILFPMIIKFLPIFKIHQNFYPRKKDKNSRFHQICLELHCMHCWINLYQSKAEVLWPICSHALGAYFGRNKTIIQDSFQWGLILASLPTICTQLMIFVPTLSWGVSAVLLWKSPNVYLPYASRSHHINGKNAWWTIS